MSLTGQTPDGKKRQGDLNFAVKHWPTPTATTGDGRSEQSAEVWQARKARTLRDKGIHNGIPLNVAVQMQPQSEQETGLLNPTWVEALMGYPPGWTDVSGQLDQDANRMPGSQLEQ
jgi:hypothetical protein